MTPLNAGLFISNGRKALRADLLRGGRFAHRELAPAPLLCESSNSRIASKPQEGE
jgi:hypothetical protein